MRRALIATLLAAIVGGCSTLTVSPAPTTPGSTAGPSNAAATTASGASPVASSSAADPGPPDLTARPLLWMAPLPPMPTGPGRPYTGSDDFLSLFASNAEWASVASRIGVFKLYGEWVAYHATPQALSDAIADIRARGLVLAVEMGPLDPPPGCGEGVESFAGLDEAMLISRRIREAGGTLQVVALDEPWYFAHVYDGPSACRWSVEEVAKAVARFTQAMRAEWPGIVVGDTEPTPTPVDAAGLSDWMRAYAAAAEEPLAFLHLDMDWSRPGWAAMAADVAARGSNAGVPIGVIFNGGSATTDGAWLTIAGKRVLEYGAEAGGDPDHVVFQSWMDKPDRVLPASDPLTFTALVARYLDDRESLGDTLGAVSNLALGMDATASASLAGARPDKAVDGVADTIWSAGAGPPAFIELDLESVATVAEIRLLVAQDPGGATEHRVTCRTSPEGDARVLGTLNGSTRDLDQLTIKLPSPVSCRYLRVRTLASPSWVAWREIEVYAPE